ncbi:hypothetical protein KL930_003105 [Ogataea haglerorum]|uniref:Cytochrome b5 heme-binding domain-containing protein n=1 Tax=Ogataea haglerorum TaxID=1937702 RepID=A0ABQ7RHK2_9ASCO|nr:hypothetical protein KL914_002989 [Ogataea haglerorum]KAG7708587.1 hypothetical protein KL950_002107 [Ogataea haglerorum]KAG7713757.1 hypothetical protein KL913_004781 [Ogataea haglerorum]KAG7714190.1 hypothetical protein KL949_004820 [Ogataea haglerorum]KAG7765818.1 hypothetical protein KL946_001998 [Ogataea haglerorum]
MSKVFTAEEVAQHNTRDDLYIIYKGKVYDCSEYLDEHPGGEEVIMDCAGTDATEPFEDIGHSEDAHEILANLEVGELKGGVAVKPAVSAAASSSPSENTICQSQSTRKGPPEYILPFVCFQINACPVAVLYEVSQPPVMAQIDPSIDHFWAPNSVVQCRQCILREDAQALFSDQLFSEKTLLSLHGLCGRPLAGQILD